MMLFKQERNLDRNPALQKEVACWSNEGYIGSFLYPCYSFAQS